MGEPSHAPVSRGHVPIAVLGAAIKIVAQAPLQKRDALTG